MELVIMIGLPGSGKSTVAKKLFPSHSYVSLDDVPKRNRNIENKQILDLLKEGKNIVIADTNITRKIRSNHINLAKQFSAKITAVFMNLPFDDIQNQNRNREKSIPEGALFKMRKELEEPSKDEGFDSIQIITKSIM